MTPRHRELTPKTTTTTNIPPNHRSSPIDHMETTTMRRTTRPTRRPIDLEILSQTPPPEPRSKRPPMTTIRTRPPTTTEPTDRPIDLDDISDLLNKLQVTTKKQKPVTSTTVTTTAATTTTTSTTPKPRTTTKSAQDDIDFLIQVVSFCYNLNSLL